MSNKKYYEEKFETLMAIADHRVKKPVNIPVGVYIQEAENLHCWCEADKDALTAVGLDWELVVDLPARIGALTEAEARWNTERLERPVAPKEWKEQSKTAYDLRNRLLESFRFAYRDHTDLLKTVRIVGKGRGHANMIQSLNSLCALGEGCPEPLARVNFDMSLLDKADETAAQMTRSLARATEERTRRNKTKKIRDRAFTHLKEAVDPIYEYGRFVFRQDSERRKGYRSHYMHQRRKKNHRKSAAEGSKTPGEQAPDPVGKASDPVGT